MSDTDPIVLDYEARVAKGIALFDEKIPDWPRRVNRDRVDIQSGTDCVTAQLSGSNSFSVGMLMLGLKDGLKNSGSYTLHGFNAETEDAPGMPPGYDQDEAYLILNRIWKREIARLQSAA